MYIIIQAFTHRCKTLPLSTSYRDSAAAELIQIRNGLCASLPLGSSSPLIPLIPCCGFLSCQATIKPLAVSMFLSLVTVPSICLKYAYCLHFVLHNVALTKPSINCNIHSDCDLVVRFASSYSSLSVSSHVVRFVRIHL